METSKKPIFVVGCPSSGTTLVYSILQSHPSVSCGNETDFLVSLRDIVEGKYWRKLQKYELDKEYWCQRLAELFDSFKAEYARRQGKNRWADKTPSYTPHLDFIVSLFPECQIVHVIRDGRDVVMSHQKRWGFKSAVKAVDIWREHVTKARDFGKTLPSNQYLELRYEDLVQDSETNAKSLFEYLDEPWDPDVLKFDKSQGFQSSEKYKSLVESRQKEAKSDSLIYKSRVGTGKKLDPILSSLLYFKNNGLLKELGYL